jgi:hypothetical protein
MPQVLWYIKYDLQLQSMPDIFREFANRDAQGRLVSLSLSFINTPTNRRRSAMVQFRNMVGLFRNYLRTEFGRILYPRGRIPAREVLPRIMGYILVQSADGRGAHMNNLNAGNLSAEALRDFLEVTMIQQSNLNVSIEELEWTFFPDRRLYDVGGAGKVKSKYIGNLYKLCLEEFEDDQGPIACAAFALNYRIYYKEKKYHQKSIDVIKQDARNFQTMMGWGRYVSISEMAEVVKKFPTYRLSILINIRKGNFRDTTFEGAQFDSSVLNQTTGLTTTQSKILYIVFDFQHYYPVSSPEQFFRKESNSKDLIFCHKCIETYAHSKALHECEDWLLDETPTRKVQIRVCEFCNQRYAKLCSCRMSRCQYCKSAKNHDGTHRCILYKTPERPEKMQFLTEGPQDGKKIALWAYDIETRIEITETDYQNIEEWELDENDRFTGEVKVFNYNLRNHKPNLLVAQNVFTGEQKIYRGDDCLKDFLFFITTYNRGKNICYAHNAAGYDTRLLFEQAIHMEAVTKKPIMRGCKFLKFTLGDVQFHDTLLHLQGSLRGLAKEYCSHVQMEKGYFPHLFNSITNYNYIGPLPEKKFFEIPLTAKNENEVHAFNSWYEEWNGRNDWNFMNELEKYCINDVLVLCEIMKAHHTILVEKFNMSPWFNTTAPGYVHEVYLRKLAPTLELPDPKEDPQGHAARIQQLAYEEHWAVLKPYEYDFARKALRGGRTEIRKIYHHVSDEEWARGVRIRYQDICSQYPYQQAVHDFPVGIPTIYTWGTSCFGSIHNSPIPTVQELLSPSWFGIVCATVDPPKNMYHPVLVHYDEELQKAVASCERIKKGVFTSVEFQKALEHGYTLIQLHRFDKYNRKPSLWKDVIKDLFIEKMVNSGPLPSLENQKRLKEAYDEAFDMGDELQKTFDENRWCKNSAKKKTFKIMLNSGWGKHAQRQNLVQSTIIHQDNHLTEQRVLFDNFSDKKFNLKSIITLNDKESMYRYDKGEALPDLHDTYIPAGLFVPAYGRLHLWEQLNKLGKRVLMNDTDSIVYLYDPQEYNIPEGDVWGEWEVEDIDKQNGGIREFVGIGPKTYSIKCENGETQTKCKGLSLKYSTEEIVNHESMKRLVFHEGVIQVSENKIKVPQQTFVYILGKGIHTHKFLKDLAFNKNDLKGILDAEGYLYPFGFIE